MKQIPGHPNYKITKDGKVWSFKGEEPKKLKPFLNCNGYYAVNLSVSGKRKRRTVHQLMAITYLGHEPNGSRLVVDHINHNQLDNRLENLQVVTQRKNISKDRNRDLPTGVYKIKDGFMSQITINYKREYLGYYKTPEEASRAYQDALALLK